MLRHPLIVALGLVTLLTAFVTWPQVIRLGTHVATHQDPLLSTWRLAWIAHALRTDPGHLFDANIFYPEPRTLAYSDATLLEGALAAPLFWAHIRPIAIYNLFLLAGFVSSGVGLFVLARYLTGSARAALVGAAVFTMAPYRIEHFMHLELQWAVWMPLTFWAVHRAVAEGSWRFGALSGVLIACQLMSSVYYGVFLAMSTVVLVSMLLAVDPARIRRGVPVLALGVLIAVALTLPYARPYIENARALGARDIREVTLYSARPINYLAAPPQNWLWGWTADRFGGYEAKLFPGVGALLLAGAALARRPRAVVLMYVALCAIAVELSFGFHGRLYPWLHAHLWVLQGLRAAVRFSIVTCCALAVLAAFGYCHLEERLVGNGRRASMLFAATLLLLALEAGSAPMSLMDVATPPPEVYRYVQTLQPGVLVELPMPAPWGLPGQDPQYMFWSTVHWNPLVNGYSGHVSPEYVKTLGIMLGFPGDASIERLKALKVRWVLIHESQYDHEPFTAMMLKLLVHPEFARGGTYRDWTGGNAHIFELKP